MSRQFVARAEILQGDAPVWSGTVGALAKTRAEARQEIEDKLRNRHYDLFREGGRVRLASLQRGAAHHAVFVALDETSCYNFDPEDAPYIEKMVGVYLIDKRERTYCCEMTPSYWLEHMSDEIYFKEETPEGVRDELQQKYCYLGGEGCYVHCHDIDGLPAEQVFDYGRCSDLEEPREYARGNGIF